MREVAELARLGQRSLWDFIKCPLPTPLTANSYGLLINILSASVVTSDAQPGKYVSALTLALNEGGIIFRMWVDKDKATVRSSPSTGIQSITELKTFPVIEVVSKESGGKNKILFRVVYDGDEAHILPYAQNRETFTGNFLGRLVNGIAKIGSTRLVVNREEDLPVLFYEVRA